MLIARGEKIDRLDNTTEEIATEAAKFKGLATELREGKSYMIYSYCSQLLTFRDGKKKRNQSDISVFIKFIEIENEKFVNYSSSR